MLSDIVRLIQDLLIFVVVMFALLIALFVIVSKMPDDNPLKRVLTALSYRVGATAAAGAVAIPIEPIPVLDLLYDFGIPILLIWYWFTFFRDAVRTMANPASQQRPHVIDADDSGQKPGLHRKKLSGSDDRSRKGIS